MSYEATGRILRIGDTQQISEKFRKRVCVVEIDPDSRYPQPVGFEFTGDRCDELDAYAPGQSVNVEFALRGREWTNPDTGEVRNFTSAVAWAIEDASGEQPQKTAPPADDGVPF